MSSTKQTNGMNERGGQEQRLDLVETPAITLTTEKPSENEATKGNQINQHTNSGFFDQLFRSHSLFFSSTAISI